MGGYELLSDVILGFLVRLEDHVLVVGDDLHVRLQVDEVVLLGLGERLCFLALLL